MHIRTKPCAIASLPDLLRAADAVAPGPRGFWVLPSSHGRCTVVTAWPDPECPSIWRATAAPVSPTDRDRVFGPVSAWPAWLGGTGATLATPQP